MLVHLIYCLLVILLRLRYRINVKGLKECLSKGKKGVLFLPNHPALIDPVIMNRILFTACHPRPLVDEKQVRQTILKYMVDDLHILQLPDLGVAGKAGTERAMKQIDECAKALKAGDNILMYPAGHIYHSRYEQLRGNGGVARIIEQYPDVRIVLVRTRGLWGSSFSRAKGYQDKFGNILNSHFKHLLLNLFFFMPKRNVDIEFTELPADFPKFSDKDTINRYLENFYNRDMPANTYVPYYWWEHGTARIMPEPDTAENQIADTSDVPESVRNAVYAKLQELSPKKDLKERDLLGSDLGLDSLMIADLLVWIQNEFSVQMSSPETLRTVGSVLLAAIGQTISGEQLKPVPPNWFVKEDKTPLKVPENATRITDTFLKLAKQNPGFVLVADQNSGVITSRKAILAIMALYPTIKNIPAERIGLIMPACAPVFIVYMAMLFAGKIPVLINWTVGSRNMKHCMKNADVKYVLTSKVVIERLEGRGTDFSEIKDTFIYLEDLKKKISIFRKLYSLASSYLYWGSLRHVSVPETAGILFTSGSENLPKAVPLTHVGFISCVSSAMKALGLRKDDSVIGMLPPFHSFGLLMNIVMPAIANLRVVYHANPMEGDLLARLVAAYHATMIVGTPTFAAGIFRNATPAQVASIRIVITGAEKCSEATYNMLKQKNPALYFLEGYGITECSPVVALNRPGNKMLGSVGTIIDSLEWMIVDENEKPLPRGETGMLYVHGPSIFNGYLNYDGPSPFVTIDGKKWYRTGDLVKATDDGHIIFMGRLKRFVKIAGEMVSLPAIEEVLLNLYRTEENPIPLAVEAKEDAQRPELVLFTNLEVQKENVNLQLKEAGFSPIYNIKHIVKLDEIPLLGTGKTDYRTLKKMAKEIQNG